MTALHHRLCLPAGAMGCPPADRAQTEVHLHAVCLPSSQLHQNPEKASLCSPSSPGPLPRKGTPTDPLPGSHHAASPLPARVAPSASRMSSRWPPPRWAEPHICQGRAGSQPAQRLGQPSRTGLPPAPCPGCPKPGPSRGRAGICPTHARAVWLTLSVDHGLIGAGRRGSLGLSRWLENVKRRREG